MGIGGLIAAKQHIPVVSATLLGTRPYKAISVNFNLLCVYLPYFCPPSLVENFFDTLTDVLSTKYPDQPFILGFDFSFPSIG